MTPTRRSLLGGFLLAAAVPSCRAMAEQSGLFAFQDDQGRPVFNYRVPSELSVDGLPGLVTTGAKTPTSVLVEFFDYNCPYCRTVLPDLDGLVGADAALRLVLVNNPILGVGSVQTAKVQQAVLRDFGPAKAYAFHKRVLSSRRPADGPASLAIVADLGLDAKRVEASADLPQVGSVLKRQSDLARALGLDATPSFVIDGIAIPGYPGPQALRRAITATRTCDKLAC